jgi:polyhydroxybutyrate depolymerase
MRPAFAFLLLAACGSSDESSEPPTIDPPAGSVKTTTSFETVDVRGSPRHYALSVPQAYAAGRAYPLVVALHGDGQDAESFRPYLGLEAFSGTDAIVAYPDHSEDLFTPYEENDDQLLIERTIAAISAKYTIDPAKVWGIGYSKGAYQLAEIACKKPGLLKAMAVHAGGAPQARLPSGDVDCPAARPLPVFVTHGELDDPAGGEFGAQYWASLARCQTTRSPTTPSICERYDGCPASTPITYCLVPDQPHSPLYADAAKHSWAWLTSL